jgi:K(+)-stimulated pyrophosphate-energized sodium pump
MDLIWIAFICGVLGIILAAYMASYVLKQDEGNKKVREISEAIKEGAVAFLGREYKILAVFVVVIALILGFVPNLGWAMAAVFVFGAVSSGLAGYIGMQVAVRANCRTAAAAEKSLNQGLRVAFRGGAVMGMSVVSIGIIGLAILYLIFHNSPQFIYIIPAFGFGASSVAIFARVGGGIYTKAADTGADIVGKVEQGIPEDDPRNAAVIADFVGDNVGDTAGMGADLFESYVDSIIATMTLATVAVFSQHLNSSLVPDQATAFWLPMIVAAAGIIASIIGIFMVRVGEKTEMGALLNALRRGTFTASIIVVILSALAIHFLGVSWGIFGAIVVGLVAGVLIGESTNYFTSYVYKPTLKIAESSQTGGATLITTGFANGLMSTLPPIILVVIAIVVSYSLGDIYGVAIAGIGMLSTLGIQDATDAYGPIADNAGGIVEMSGMPAKIRERTDALDSLGNTTAATGKGFAIGAAGITSLALLLSYTEAAGIQMANMLDPKVISGIFLGAMIPAVFCALTLDAVGKTAYSIINEVRRQFNEIAGLREGKEGVRPEYGKCVAICTTASLKQMIAPGIITIVSPVIVGFLLGKEALAGFLIGAIACGFILAVTFSNAGGSWDNAKKWVETGAFGGKGSEAHKATVIGDTVGDPMKDTSGPSLNIMIKLMSIVALVMAPVMMNQTGLF